MKILKPLNRTEFSPVPEGVYDVFICEIKEARLRSKWGEDDGIGVFYIIRSGDYKGRKIYEFITPNLRPPRSKCYMLCKVVMGREFTPEEMAIINDLESLAQFIISKPLKVFVVNYKTRDGGTRWKVSGHFETELPIAQEEINELINMRNKNNEEGDKEVSDKVVEDIVDQIVEQDKAPRAQPK